MQLLLDARSHAFVDVFVGKMADEFATSKHRAKQDRKRVAREAADAEDDGEYAITKGPFLMSGSFRLVSIS